MDGTQRVGVAKHEATRRRALRWLAAAAVASALSLSGGCAAMRASMARQDVVHESTARHVYAMPCVAVWPAVRMWLFEQGFAVLPFAESPSLVETGWRTEYVHQSARIVRYAVQALAPTPESCQLLILKSTQTGTQFFSARDLYAEWVMLQRLDPVAAQRIADQANAVGAQYE